MMGNHFYPKQEVLFFLNKVLCWLITTFICIRKSPTRWHKWYVKDLFSTFALMPSTNLHFLIYALSFSV